MMQKVSKEAAFPRFTPGITKLTSPAGKTLTKILLVPFRNGEAVNKHPDLASLLADGWSISSAVPRIVETEGTRLLVVLMKPEQSARLTRIK
jgi:hypothetical protein